ncbi:MAG: MATE family efflux transporter [Saprospiraceae bacterium]|nr:MATE family efflux transporter [Saprospiraceae bacterium]
MSKKLKLFWEAIKGEEKDYTTVSIKQAIFLLAVPMMLEMSGEALFALVDTYFVAQVGPLAVATIGFTETIMTLVYSLAIGISAAATAMVARRIGEKKREEANITAFQVILLGLIISFTLGIVGFYFAEDILAMIGASEEVISSGVGYTKIMFATNVVIMMLFLLNGIFRGAGNASIAMWSLWVANIINIILDPCFIFGWGPFPAMGVEGAAVATSVGRGLGVLFQLYILFFGGGILTLLRKHIRIRLAIITRLIRIAVGGTFQFIIASASWIFLMRIVAEFGSNVVAGYVIAIRLLIFTILPSWGMANAAATLVGQNLGAGQPERAEKSVWETAKYNMLFLLTVSIIYAAFAPLLIGVFSSDPEVIASGILSLRIISAGYVFFAYGMVVGQAFNGAGDTFTPTLLNFIAFWLLEIPLAYTLSTIFEWGPTGVYVAVAISESILAVLCIIVFRRGKWKLVEV